MLENVFETINLKGKEYNIENIATISDKFLNKEYICEIDLQKMKYMFRCQNVTFYKTIKFINDSNTLLVEYDIFNENDERIKFSITPLITYRDQVHMKKASYLKFGSRSIENGVLVNLSISDNENLNIVCENTEYTKIDSYMNNVKHEVTNLDLKKDIFIEDLYIPGKFELYVGSQEKKKISFFVSNENLKSEKNEDNIENEEESQFIELVKLKRSVIFLENNSLNSLPGTIVNDNYFDCITEKNYSNILIELLTLIKSIDGRYICLKMTDEAKIIILKYIDLLSRIKLIETDNILYYKCRLWLVEIINKLYVTDSEKICDKIKDYLCDSISEILELLEKNRVELVNDIEIVSLMYNSIKIYEEILKDIRYTNIAIDITETIERDFWNEENRIIKKNAFEMETIARVDMLYAICLSYPAVSKSISIKILDTVFRELYTPYGLREIKRRRTSNVGVVYPKYMASFIYANLSQNGNSYASKKIAYNLIKDLLLDLDKYVKDNVKYVYSEKGIDIDFKALDYYTTCEMIRLYSMFM